MGETGKPITRAIDLVGKAFFQVIRIVLYAAPIGAFGAMAFAIGEYGVGTLTSLFWLIIMFYAASIFFVVVVLGIVATFCGINIFKLLRHLKEEMLIMLGTSTSALVLPQLMKKLEHLGAPKPIVRLVVPGTTRSTSMAPPYTWPSARSSSHKRRTWTCLSGSSLVSSGCSYSPPRGRPPLAARVSSCWRRSRRSAQSRLTLDFGKVGLDVGSFGVGEVGLVCFSNLMPVILAGYRVGPPFQTVSEVCRTRTLTLSDILAPKPCRN